MRFQGEQRAIDFERYLKSGSGHLRSSLEAFQARALDNASTLPYERMLMAMRASTVRISAARLCRLLRARKAATQSELINTLLAEEEERLRSHAVLRATARTARISHVDARLL